MNCFRRALPAVLFLFIVSLSASLPPAGDNLRFPLGVNLWFFSDNQAVWPFTDFFKQSRPFWAQPAESSFPWKLDTVLDLDKNGYPSSLPRGIAAATVLFWEAKAPVPLGEYICHYDGEGKISFGYDAEVLKRRPGRILVKIAKGTGTLLKIVETNPRNPVRNIRLLAPGMEEEAGKLVFHPAFLDRLKPFRVVRFMDWMRAISSTVERWEDRTRPEDQTQAGPKGAALEHMIDLCNALGCDCWITIPSRADDDFIRRTAAMIRDRLQPPLKAYVEWSNEVWNPSFEGHRWATEKGEALGLGKGGEAMVAYWAMRVKKTFLIFEEAFGPDFSKRIVRVAASRIGDTELTRRLLETEGLYQHTDVLAVAPYLTIRKGARGLDEVFADLRLVREGLRRDYRSDMGLLSDKRFRKIRYVTYEGGLDFSNDPKWALPVRRDPRVAGVYAGLFKDWKETGGTLFMHYTFCDPDWGLLENMLQPPSDSYLFQAVMEFARGNPQWWEEPGRAGDPGGLRP